MKPCCRRCGQQDPRRLYPIYRDSRRKPICKVCLAKMEQNQAAKRKPRIRVGA